MTRPSAGRADPRDPGDGAGNTRARYRRILRFAAWNLAVTWWYELFLPRIGLVRITESTRAPRMQRVARRFRVLALDLGGLMIKVGQFLSSRLDVLPPELTTELEDLQDEVPPVPFDAIRALAEAEFGLSLDQVFASVDPQPVAAASLGQAHRATLLPFDAAQTGLRDVVLKVQRPGIAAIVDVDLAALRRVGRWLSHFRLVSDRVDMPALIREFAQTSLQEIDYLHEAASAERFAADFADDARVTVPAIVWERSSRRVLTLEDVTAIKITDAASLRRAGIDPVQVAPVFAAVMFEQLFANGYFHADPHPGNIFVTPDAAAGSESGWKLTFIDFGMMGEVEPGTRSGLRKLLIAAAARDGKALVRAIGEIGILLPSSDTAELERAMTALFARFGGMGFAQLRDVDPSEFADFATEFGETVRSLPFQLPENFLLIIRAMSLTSGVCSSLDPRFNLWDSIEPYAAQLLRDERGNVALDLLREALGIAAATVALPKRVNTLLETVENGSLILTSPQLERRVARIERTQRRLIAALLFGVLLITGAIVRAGDTVLGSVLMFSSILPVLPMLFSRQHRR